MAFDAKILEVMIASPGEVVEERAIVRDVLNSWNTLHARSQRAAFLPLGWETNSSPDLGGRPQQMINDRLLSRCDLLVGIFWTRIGSPTGMSISGTVEEIREHHAAGRPVMLYFSDRPIPPDRLDVVQYAEVRKLREWAYQEGIVGGYDSLQDLRSQLERHLHIILQENQYLKDQTRIATGQADGLPLSARRSEPALSPQALELLKAAASDRDGMIMVRRLISGTIVHAGDKEFAGDSGDKRELARWLAAVEEIHAAGLSRDLNGKQELFELTDAGYRASDEA